MDSRMMGGVRQGLGLMAIAVMSCGCSPDSTGSTNGANGAAGIAAAGVGGFAGTGATAGINGVAGTSGVAGVTGLAGVSGFAGTSGDAAGTGSAGVGAAGTNAAAGVSGAAGMDAAAGVSGVAGTDGAAGTGDVTPTACTGPQTLAPGAQMTVMLNGRQYLLHVGDGVKAGQAAPLVFSLHGLNMTPSSMESMAKWFPLADSEGFIVAGPAGIGSSNGWNLSGAADFDLMKAVIEDINSKICVDRKRIYATGFSHGGFMSNAIGCKLADVFAAVAPHSGAGGGACSPARPMPVYAWHGDADGIVSYSSGSNTVNAWVTRNKCTGAPTDYMVNAATCKEWASCDAGVKVKFCTIPNGSHRWYAAATAAIWEFFKQNTLP